MPWLLAQLAMLAISACSPPEEPPSAIVLISIDTLRADRLGLYGYDRPLSPSLDIVAERATVFDQALSTSTWTLPAHASMFLSQDPHEHGVTAIGRRVSEGANTLTELLAEQGYRTAGFYTSALLSEENGFGQGFGHYQQVRGDPAHNGAAVNRAALAWIDEGVDPFFLFLHYYDVHAPYSSRRSAAPSFCQGEHTYDEIALEVAARFLANHGIDDEAFSRESSRVFHRQAVVALSQRGLGSDVEKRFSQGLRLNQGVTGPEQSCVAGLYDDGVAYVDQLLGELFAALKSREIFDRALIVVTSDHGEMLYDRDGYRAHRESLHASVTNVPLVMKSPFQGEGRRIGGPPVSLLDLAPTILDFAGVVAPAEYRGRSLRHRTAERDDAEPTPLLIEVDLEEGPTRALVVWPWKLIVDPRASDNAQLFHLAVDPSESQDLAASRPRIVRRMREALAHRTATPAMEPGAGEVELGREEIEELRALGYLQ